MTPTPAPSHLPCLAIDTSTEMLSLTLADAQGRVWEHSGGGGAQASSALLPAVGDLMAQAHIQGTDLHCLVMGRGPGAFTGLRTACAVVQGLAYGWRSASCPQGLPVLALDSLMAVAQAAYVQNAAIERVVSVLDARMHEVYVAAYERINGVWQTRLPSSLCAPAEVASLLGARAPDVAQALKLGDPATVCAGNAWDVYEAALANLPGSRCVAVPSAGAFLGLAAAAWSAGDAVQPAQALPLYVRDKVALTTAEREATQHLS